jgi:hypothetical protein
VVRVIALGTPFVLTLTLRIAGEHIDVSADVNVAFGPTHLGDAVAVPEA